MTEVLTSVVLDRSVVDIRKTYIDEIEAGFGLEFKKLPQELGVGLEDPTSVFAHHRKDPEAFSQRVDGLVKCVAGLQDLSGNDSREGSWVTGNEPIMTYKKYCNSLRAYGKEAQAFDSLGGSHGRKDYLKLFWAAAEVSRLIIPKAWVIRADFADRVSWTATPERGVAEYPDTKHYLDSLVSQLMAHS